MWSDTHSILATCWLQHWFLCMLLWVRQLSSASQMVSRHWLYNYPLKLLITYSYRFFLLRHLPIPFDGPFVKWYILRIMWGSHGHPSWLELSGLDPSALPIELSRYHTTLEMYFTLCAWAGEEVFPTSWKISAISKCKKVIVCLMMKHYTTQTRSGMGMWWEGRVNMSIVEF